MRFDLRFTQPGVVVNNISDSQWTEMDRLSCKLVSLSKPMKVTDNNKDTSLVGNLFIHCKSVMFSCTDPWFI